MGDVVCVMIFPDCADCFRSRDSQMPSTSTYFGQLLIDGGQPLIHPFHSGKHFLEGLIVAVPCCAVRPENDDYIKDV